MAESPLPQLRRDVYDRLLDRLRGLGGAAIGFSGGVDSTLLLRAALDALPRGRVLGVTIQAEGIPDWEVENARALAGRLDAPWRLVTCSQLAIEACRRSDTDRCYHCKRALFGRVREEADRAGLPHLLDGSTGEDVSGGDWRPGLRAARELGVVSPLAELDLDKTAIRAMARDLGLPNWDQPSAACLLSRFPYGTEVTKETLKRVERSEAFLRAEGFDQVRVRFHGDVARIETAPEDFERLAPPDRRARVAAALRGFGFRHVALDLTGYRTGSMNEGLGLTDEPDERKRP